MSHFFIVVDYILDNISKYFNDFTSWLSGERSLLFVLPVGTMECNVIY